MESNDKDSLGKLIEDVEQVAACGCCQYFGGGVDGSCHGCPADADDGPCDKSVFKDISCRLHALMPHDRKGVEIKPGDTIKSPGGKEQVCITDVLLVPAIVKSEGADVTTYAMPWLWHVVQPDSWEKLEQDATLCPHDYLTNKDASDKRYGIEAMTAMAADLVRRAKALTKAGEQG